LIAGNLDAAVLPYSFGESAKRAGFRALADAANLGIAYQGSGLCAEKSFVAANAEIILQLVKGLSEAVAFIEEGRNKQDVMLILKRMLRFDKTEEAEASYGLLRLMTNLNLGPNLAAWKLMQRIVARVNPKVSQLEVSQLVDGSFVRKLEEDGFLPELRKKQK
jgi:ABC-type nitrate/sulfonate/bicarbonate transport system substrate-binding protein